MTEWKEYKLGEFIKVKHGFAFKGDYIVSDETDKILVTPGNFHIGGGFKSDKFKYYNSEEFPQDYILKDGDIVVTMTDLSKDSDTLGYSAIIPFSKNKKYLHNQRIGLVQFISDEVCHNFVYWLLRTKEYQSYIVGSASGTSIMHTSPSRIENYSCLFPPLDEQRRIASILSSLDDKIDHLHRENATLEQMAETLFRQWFVVEAKEEWEEGTVAAFAQQCKEPINPQKHPNSIFLHYSIPAFDGGKNPTVETGENIQSNKYLVPSNCILFSKLNPHKDKRVWLMLNDVPDNAICSTEFQIVKPIKPEYLYFLYGWLMNKENYDEIASGVGGTSGSHQRIDPKSIFSFTCPNVDFETIRNYNNKVEPLFYKIINNQKQIQTLIQTRDGLLPKLMSGEVKVK